MFGGSKSLRVKICSNCTVPTGCVPKIIILAFYIANRLPSQVFSGVLGAESQEIRVRQKLTGLAIFVTNCLRLSYY